MPSISVVLPVFNRTTVIDRAVGSILAQEFEDFEIVIVDDGSTDDSADVAEDIGDERIRVIRLPHNSGVGAARNRGILEARGELICFLDSDDVFLPKKLSTVASRFAADPDLGVLVDSFITVDPTAAAKRGKYRLNTVAESNETFRLLLFSRRLWKATPAITVRKSVAVAAGLFDEMLRRREDFEFLLRTSRITRCASTDEILWVKYRSPHSLSAPLDTFIEPTITLCTRYPEYLSIRSYRRGLARDLTRHVLKVTAARRLDILSRDLAKLVAALGPLTVLNLLCRGLGMSLATARADSAASSIEPKLRRPLIVRIGKKARSRINRLVSRFSLVPVTPIVGTEHFPWLRQIEQATPLIQAEAEYLLKHLSAVPPMNQMSPDHERIAGDGGWRSFFLVGYGYRIEENCGRCPHTSKALENVPGLVTALFSILEPGMHVARHRGVSRGIMIAHLGLRVPREAHRCHMDVDGERVQWEEGRTFVFDDTYPHEVWNDTNEHRVILLIQFLRPMGIVGRTITNALIAAVRHSPYIQDARKNVTQWENRLRRLEQASRASS